jgi:hypothetical protein
LVVDGYGIFAGKTGKRLSIIPANGCLNLNFEDNRYVSSPSGDLAKGQKLLGWSGFSVTESVSEHESSSGERDEKRGSRIDKGTMRQ